LGLFPLFEEYDLMNFFPFSSSENDVNARLDILLCATLSIVDP